MNARRLGPKASLTVLCVLSSIVVLPNLLSAQDAGPKIVAGNTPRIVTEGGIKPVRAMDPAQMLRLTLTLEAPNRGELDRFLKDVYDPRSPKYHQFLSFDQWKRRYAPPDANVAKVTAWARRSGFNVLHSFRNNLAIKVEADAGTIQNAFAIQINHYETPDRKFFSNDRDPSIPAELRGILKNVQGLNSYYRVHPASRNFDHVSDDEPIYRPGPFRAEASSLSNGKGRATLQNRILPQLASQTGDVYSSISGGISSTSIEAPDLFTSEGYNLGQLQNYSNCCNPDGSPSGSSKETSVAIIGQNSFNENDLKTFTQQYGMAYNFTQVMINGPSCCDDEMTLDVEWSTAFSNSFGNGSDTAHVWVYEGGGTKLDDLLDAWEEAQSDDNARSGSSSFGSYEDAYGGIGDPSISDFTDAINAMAASGWTLAVSSGDHGATMDCSTRSVHFPASSPNVIAAGGTTLSMSNNAGKPKYTSEVTWTGPGCNGGSGSGTNNGGGGGGCAGTEPAGFWQVLGTSACGNKRALPDISLNAGNGQMWYYGGWKNTGGGTSVVAPELAGFFAQVNSYLKSLGNICGATFSSPCAPLGNPNPYIYLMGIAHASSNQHNPFYDITSGCNGGDNGDVGFCATTDYDLATGWGSFNMLQLAWGFNANLAGRVNPDVSFTGPAINSWYNSNKILTFKVNSPTVSGTSATVGAIGSTSAWDTAIADVKSHATPGSGDSFYDGPATYVTNGLFSLATAGEGCHTAHVRGWDNAGVTTDDTTYGPICYDITPPTAPCYPADGLWHATDVTTTCFGSDQSNLSGLANPADSSFQLMTSVPAGTETNNALTNTHQVCDVAGNCITAGPVGNNMVDKKAPSITINAPTNSQYIINQPVAADYSCADGGSGVANCSGPVASGSNFDTSGVGSKTFTVNSTDNVGNASMLSVNYTVTYRICLAYDPTKPVNGRGQNITVQLCDYNGNNISKASIILTATGVDGSAAKLKALGTLNPGNVFLYGPGTSPGASYLYLLDSQLLSNGMHVLNFVVSGDPVPHVAAFTIKK